MKISERWLREWVNPSLNINKIAEKLTSIGLEVESVSAVAGEFSQVVVGYIKSVAPHPDPKVSRLQVCQVDIGTGPLLSIVCGAANARAGIRVAVACLGATLPNNVTIKEVKLRGVVSEGMLCSKTELGMAQEAEGILELPLNAPLGQDLGDYLQLDDQVIDVHLTPNRGDCLSVKGLARDLAALTASPLHDRPISQASIEFFEKYSLSVESVEDCPCYCGRIIRGINPHAQSPIWLTERLRRAGFRAIHPVVDVTNYVMLELGQPLHAFDLARLDAEVKVRRAKKGEKLILLDGKQVCFDIDTLVIADKTQVQAIAGVMGGIDSSVSSATTDIFLESAFFNPTVIAGRARHYGINSEAAHRFERGVDSNLASPAMERATQLLIEIVGGEVGPVNKSQVAAAKSPSILLRQARIKKILGMTISAAEITSILQRLGMIVDLTAEAIWQVTPPSWRFDIHREEDIIEELVRIHGYDKIPNAFAAAEQHLHPCAETEIPLSRLRHLLVDRDFREAITYSFISPQLQKMLDPQSTPYVLLNPISTELSVMRTSLWPGLIKAAIHNQNQNRQQLRIRLFETGLCFQSQQGKLSQNPYLAAIAIGNCVGEQWGIAAKPLDFFTVKSDVESLLRLNGQLANTQFIPLEHSALHPGQSSQIVQAEKVIGHFGALHPKLAEELGLLGPVYLFELSLSALTAVSLPSFVGYSNLPVVRRDLSFWIEEKFTAQCILEQARANAGPWLNDTYLFDIYYDKNKAKARRSLALALFWQHPSRTLVDKEVDDLLKQVIEGLKQHFAIQLRE